MKKINCFVTIASIAALLHVPESRAQSWTNLGSGMDAPVTSLAFDPSAHLYAAGWFTSAGGATIYNIAKWERNKLGRAGQWHW